MAKCIICGDEYDASVLTTHTRRNICEKGECFNKVEALINAAYPKDIWWLLETSTRVYNLPWNELMKIGILVNAETCKVKKKRKVN